MFDLNMSPINYAKIEREKSMKMTARQFLNMKFPEYEKERGRTGHDDKHTENMMEEYAQYITSHSPQ